MVDAERPRDVVEGSGHRGENRHLDQMISARFDPVLIVELKRLAAGRGMSLSDVLRLAALLLIPTQLHGQDGLDQQTDITLPFLAPRGYVYQDLDEVQVCDLRSGDVICVDGAWETVLSLRPVDHFAIDYVVATHSFVTDDIRARTYLNSPDRMLSTYQRIDTRIRAVRR